MRIARKAIKGLVLAFAAGVLFGLLCITWLNLSMGIWHDYGDLTFMWWLVGNALVMAVGVVALW